MSGRPGAGPAVIIRDAAPTDLPIIRSIYACHVLHGLASFKEVPPDAAEIERRYRDILARGLPYVVAECDARVAGFAYAGPYRTRPAYRYTVEDSVYIAPDAVGRGFGQAALSEIIRRVTALGFRQMIAVIGDSENRLSIRLHEKVGFCHAAGGRVQVRPLGRQRSHAAASGSRRQSTSRPLTRLVARFRKKKGP